jgi:hypothetical protein
MYQWLLEHCCDHKTLELRTIKYNTSEITCTVIDHEIYCSKCGKIFVDRTNFDKIQYLISQI